MTRVTASAFIATIVGVPLAVATFAQAVRPVAVDPWSVTSEDDTAANLTYLSTPGSQVVKVRAVIQADRLRVKARVGAETARPARRVWLDRAEEGKIVGRQLIDLDVYTSVDIPTGDGDILFYESGFATARAPKTPAVESHLRAYYGAADLGSKGGPK